MGVSLPTLCRRYRRTPAGLDRGRRRDACVRARHRRIAAPPRTLRRPTRTWPNSTSRSPPRPNGWRCWSSSATPCETTSRRRRRGRRTPPPGSRGTPRRLEDLRDRAGAIAASAYRTGPASQVSAVLAAGSPGAIVDQLTALEALGLQARGQLSGLADLLASLRRERAALTALSQRAVRAGDGARRPHRPGRAGPGRPPSAAQPNRRGRTTRPPPRRRRWSRVPPVPRSRYAYAQIGKPYVYGAAGPAAFDCSGLTKAAWAAAGVTLPHNAARQYSSMAHLARADLAPGDLVFYYSDIHHVAIYIGNGHGHPRTPYRRRRPRGRHGHGADLWIRATLDRYWYRDAHAVRLLASRRVPESGMRRAVRRKPWGETTCWPK